MVTSGPQCHAVLAQCSPGTRVLPPWGYLHVSKMAVMMTLESARMKHTSPSCPWPHTGTEDSGGLPLRAPDGALLPVGDLDLALATRPCLLTAPGTCSPPPALGTKAPHSFSCAVQTPRLAHRSLLPPPGLLQGQSQVHSVTCPRSPRPLQPTTPEAFCPSTPRHPDSCLLKGPRHPAPGAPLPPRSLSCHLMLHPSSHAPARNLESLWKSPCLYSRSVLCAVAAPALPAPVQTGS